MFIPVVSQVLRPFRPNITPVAIVLVSCTAHSVPWFWALEFTRGVSNGAIGIMVSVYHAGTGEGALS